MGGLRHGCALGAWLCGSAAGCVLDWSLPAADASTQSSTSDSNGDATDATTTDVPGNAQAGKWVRTAALKFGDANLAAPAEETAQFDLIIASPHLRSQWGSGELSSWENLRALNPDMKILLMYPAPDVYDASAPVGDGWEWIVSNHGFGTTDPWTGGGIANPMSYLVASGNIYSMNLGHAPWRDYHIEQLETALLEEGSVDGAFFLRFNYEVSWKNQWSAEVAPGVLEPDHPLQYHDGNDYLDSQYRADVDLFFDEAIPRLQQSGFVVGTSFDSLSQVDPWAELAERTVPLFVASGSSPVVSPYGELAFNVHNFDTAFEVLRTPMASGLIVSMGGDRDKIGGPSGLARMDMPASTGPADEPTEITGWDALWFALCLHMAAIDPSRDDVYFYFSVWSSLEYHYFEEFDPRYLHLGEPVAEAFEAQGAWFREFDDGWVAFNPSGTPLAGLSVPDGQARVITHEVLTTPDTQPLVETFDLPVHRGVVLLRDGAVLGNGM